MPVGVGSGGPDAAHFDACQQALLLADAHFVEAGCGAVVQAPCRGLERVAARLGEEV